MNPSNNNESASLGYSISNDKTLVETSNYDPPEELKRKYFELEQKLNINDMNHFPGLLKPTNIASSNFNQELNKANYLIGESIKVLKEPGSRELEEVKQQKEELEKRVEIDKKHLETLNKAKEETKFSSPADISKDIIPGLFEQLEKDLGELTKITKDEKQIQEVYTKVLSYIRNKSVEDGGDTNEECAFCIKTENAYKYIQTQFKKVTGEDKWVSVLDDQVRICKLHSRDKHQQPELDKSFNNKNADVIKIAKELHILCFAFGHLLQFKIKDKAYTKVEFEGKVIFNAIPSFNKSNQA